MATAGEECRLAQHQPADALVAEAERVEQAQLTDPLHDGHHERVRDGEEHDEQEHGHVDHVHVRVHAEHAHHLGYRLRPRQHLEAVAGGVRGGGDRRGNLVDAFRIGARMPTCVTASPMPRARCAASSVV
jgi:hypothetical protein